MERVIKTLTQFNLGPIIQFVINGIMSIFSQLQNIEFLGTNMLQFSVTLMIIGTMVPLIITIAKSFSFAPRYERRKWTQKDIDKRYNDWKEGGFKD